MQCHCGEPLTDGQKSGGEGGLADETERGPPWRTVDWPGRARPPRLPPTAFLSSPTPVTIPRHKMDGQRKRGQSTDEKKAERLQRRWWENDPGVGETVGRRRGTPPGRTIYPQFHSTVSETGTSSLISRQNKTQKWGKQLDIRIAEPGTRRGQGTRY